VGSKREIKKETPFNETLAMEISLCASTKAHIKASPDKIMGVS
jgi:hypothetical protein